MPTTDASRPISRGMSRLARLALGIGLLAGSAGIAPAQGQKTDIGVERPESLPAWVVFELNRDLEGARRLSAQTERRELERELRKIRHDFFRAGEHTEVRQIGLRKLRKHADRPEAYPLLLEVFRRSDKPTREAVLDMLMDQETAEADLALAWAAIHERDEWMRAEAVERLKARLDEAPDETEAEVDPAITYVVAHRILEQDERYLASAASLADSLSIVQVIPHLIHAQVQGTRTGTERAGDKGWILIGRQVGFVSDLQPVVADSAVAFDPTLSVVTEGALLRVQDGVVVTYRTEVQAPLMRLGSRAIGYDLADKDLGWDQSKWWAWYRDELLPQLAGRNQETAEGG